MGLHPYVPRLVINDDRYRPTGLIRVVDYPDPYPHRTSKIVTVENLDGQRPHDAEPAATPDSGTSAEDDFLVPIGGPRRRAE